MITVRCKECRKELTSTSKVQFCGCLTKCVVEDRVGANDLSKVVMVSNNVERLTVISQGNFFIKNREGKERFVNSITRINSFMKLKHIKTYFLIESEKNFLLI